MISKEDKDSQFEQMPESQIFDNGTSAESDNDDPGNMSSSIHLTNAAASVSILNHKS